MANAYRESVGFPPLVVNRTSASISVSIRGQMLTDRPEILRTWDYERNAIDPTTVKASAPENAHWRCHRDHRWATSVRSRCALLVGCQACGFEQAAKTKGNLKLSELLLSPPAPFIGPRQPAEPVEWFIADEFPSSMLHQPETPEDF